MIGRSATCGFDLSTDVLVIGGGPAGCWAAIAATEAGASVSLVDKGRVASGIPRIARLDDCQTCFLCELYCPADALYVSPFKDSREHIDETDLIARGLLGSYRRALGWRGIKASAIDLDLSHRLPEPDGTPWER